MNWYCDKAPGNPIHEAYHSEEYGFPITDERALFELLSLELFQAGLSWELILKKRATTVAAFDGFDVDIVARYGKRDVNRLLKDPGIIRNRLKVQAVIDNANRVIELRDGHGGFAEWLAVHHPRSHAEWTKLFRTTFKFMGGEIVNEFLMCIGYLPGAHRKDCPAYGRVAKAKPPWMGVDPMVFRSK
ncbi:MAG: DNA-3-methyladenine glycosylase I [Rhodospirillales bacterium]